MRSPTRWTGTACALLLLAGAACAGGPEARGPWHDWTTLRLKARAIPLFSGRVEMRRSAASDEWRLETATSARFFGATIARSWTVTVMDPATGQTREYRSYSRKRGRRYLFGDEGYAVEKLRPASKPDARGEGGDWEVASRHEYPYPAHDDGDGPVRLFDYYGMLLHLHEFDLDAPGDEVTLFVATSDGPRAYRILVSDSRSVERAFTDLATGEKTRLTSREFRLNVVPADPDSEEGFLDMEGETEIWVEAESKTPLEIVGKIPKVPGKVKLILAALG